MEFVSSESCRAALLADGHNLLGRPLQVAPSQAGAEESGLAPVHTLYVSNLPYDVSADDVVAAFVAAGATQVNPIRAVRLLKDADGKGKGGAFVDFSMNLGLEVLKLDGLLKLRIILILILILIIFLKS